MYCLYGPILPIPRSTIFAVEKLAAKFTKIVLLENLVLYGIQYSTILYPNPILQ